MGSVCIYVNVVSVSKAQGGGRGCSSVGRVLPGIHKISDLILGTNYINWVCCYAPVIPEIWRLEDQKFTVIFNYRVTWGQFGR